MEQASYYCRACNRPTLHLLNTSAIPVWAGLLLGLLSCGIALFVVIPWWILEGMGGQKWHCQACGRLWSAQ
jgi:hypothetical protein